MLYRRSKKQIRGFTLIELLVSITIFVVIAVLTTSTLVLLSQVNRTAIPNSLYRAVKMIKQE